MRIRVHGPPCACQWTPPFERRNMAPFANAPPPLERRNTARAIDIGGGGYTSGNMHMQLTDRPLTKCPSGTLRGYCDCVNSVSTLFVGQLPPPPPCPTSGSLIWPQLPSPRFTWARSISTKSAQHLLVELQSSRTLPASGWWKGGNRSALI